MNTKTKKLLIALFIGMLFFNSKAFSQCDEYPYILDIDGFVCDEDEGTICFNTGYDVLSAGTCSDYVVEIEYPTEAFIYTDLNPDPSTIYLHYEDDDITILRIKPWVVSVPYVDFSSCIEGYIQIPGTVFTIRIVHENNPNDVVSQETFTVDDVITIGALGETTILSEAIEQGLLLPAADAVTTGQ